MRSGFAFAIVAALLLLAGCLGKPSQSAGEGTASASPVVTTVAPATATGFWVENFTIAPGDGRARALHEDDNATARYALRNPATGGGASSFLVSFLVGGAVRDVQTVTLAPGKSKTFSYPLGSVRGLKSLDVEVKAGDQDVRRHTDVTPWPRAGDLVDLGPAIVTVNGYAPNATSGGTDVDLTIAQRALPQGDWHLFRVDLLCADARGNVTASWDAHPPVPGPDNSTQEAAALPACPDVVYGVALLGNDASWQPFYERVLFVPAGWSPPQP